MAILLQSRLLGGPGAEAGETPDEAVHTTYSWADPPTVTQVRAEARRACIEQVVETVAEHERHDAEAVERLGREAAERLERDDIYRDVLARPASEIIADLCRDLGLTPDWPVLSRQSWARREMAGEVVGAPLLPRSQRQSARHACTAPFPNSS
jgi:hypothetical protein